MEEDTVVPKLSVYYSTLSCLFLSLIYVGSLYVWRSEHNRYTELITISFDSTINSIIENHLHLQRKKIDVEVSSVFSIESAHYKTDRMFVAMCDFVDS